MSDRAHPTKEKHAIFHRWEIIISLGAALVSVVSLLITLHQIRTSSAPNIQLINVNATRSYFTFDENSASPREDVEIHCTATLENLGNAPASIIDIKWEALNTREVNDSDQTWLAISDNGNPKEEPKDDNFYYLNRKNPVAGVHQPLIQASEVKKLYLFFHGIEDTKKGQEISNIRVRFIFSNGQELTVLPGITAYNFGGTY
jgi:hypothetical protein